MSDAAGEEAGEGGEGGVVEAEEAEGGGEEGEGGVLAGEGDEEHEREREEGGAVAEGAGREEEKGHDELDGEHAGAGAAGWAGGALNGFDFFIGAFRIGRFNHGIHQIQRNHFAADFYFADSYNPAFSSFFLHIT